MDNKWLQIKAIINMYNIQETILEPTRITLTTSTTTDSILTNYNSSDDHTSVITTGLNLYLSVTKHSRKNKNTLNRTSKHIYK